MGNDRRHMLAKRELSESRMHTARARVSWGSLARFKRESIRDGEGSRRDAADGIRLDRWILGPERTVVSTLPMSEWCSPYTYLARAPVLGSLRNWQSFVVACLHLK